MAATLQDVFEVTFQSGLKSCMHTYQSSLRYQKLIDLFQSVLNVPSLNSLYLKQYLQTISLLVYFDLTNSFGKLLNSFGTIQISLTNLITYLLDNIPSKIHYPKIEKNHDFSTIAPTSRYHYPNE